MRAARFVGVMVLASILLVGCAIPSAPTVPGSSVSVALPWSVTSLNPNTSFGDTPANIALAYATGSGFTRIDPRGNVVKDTSFGSYEKLSDDPLTVRYTIEDGVRWSDGSAMDAADLLLAWVAMSGAYNDPDVVPRELVDPATGQLTPDYPEDVVYFDSGADPLSPTGIALASRLPTVGDDAKSITITYDRPFTDWETAFLGQTSPAMPAHVVARQALHLPDELDDQDAKSMLISAITDRDDDALAAIARFWNSGFTVGDTQVPDSPDIITDGPDVLDSADPVDSPDLLVSSGPYSVSAFDANSEVVLVANESYSGSRQPHVEEVRMRFVQNPLAAVQALDLGEVQVVYPPLSADLLSADLLGADLLGTSDQAAIEVVRGDDSAFERVELRVEGSRSGLFTDPRVRSAFLKTVPRQQIVDEVVRPLQDDALIRDSFLFDLGAEGYAESVAANGSASSAAVDIDGALALLSEAGVSSPEVCILFDPNDALQVSEFSLIRQSASRAGFVVSDCSRTDWTSALGVAGQYDAVLLGRQVGGPGEAAYRIGTIEKINGYSDSEIDDLLVESDVTTREFDRREVLTRLDERLWTEAIGLPLYQRPAILAVDHDRVDNVSLSPFAPSVFWNVWEWIPVDPAQ